MKALLLILTTMSLGLPATAQTKPVLYPKLSKTLDSLVAVDQQPMQAMMQHAIADSTRNRLIAAEQTNFSRHQPVLEAIVQKYGYPGFKQVGEKSSNNFWLLVQHADAHPEFQQQVLRLMLPEVKSKNANSSNYAYLTDRVALGTGQPQEYGTQLEYKAIGLASPRNLRDPAQVNQRRKTLGMPPLADYLKMAGEAHRKMNMSAAK
ncbi:MAG: hypothetical protein H7Z21_09195 [Hymenobacter sp.]|nr:hypothetical protein [Hymenobacter sp.]